MIYLPNDIDMHTAIQRSLLGAKPWQWGEQSPGSGGSTVLAVEGGGGDKVLAMG